MDLKQTLLRVGLGAGLARVGVTTADPFPEVAGTLADRKAAGLAGGLGFTFRDPGLATQPRTSFPWAMSLVVGAYPYEPAGQTSHRPGHARVAAAARLPAYLPLRTALTAMAREVVDAGYRGEVVADDNRLVDRAVAVRAGIGWWGKNTMVLAPGIGPWFLLGSVVTDAVLEPDPAMTRDCGTCRACLPACPTGALVAPGVLDARRCLAAWAQTPGVFPREYRAAMGERIYGCDECLEACPPGRRLVIGSAHDSNDRPLSEILVASDRTLLAWYGHWFIPDRNPRIIRRNSLIAAGNSGLELLVPAVAPYTGHNDWLLRLHSVWALQNLPGEAARAVLADRNAVETNPLVRDELDLSPSGNRRGGRSR